MPSSILSIGTAVPKYESKQADLAQFMTKYLHLDPVASRKAQVLFNLSGIGSRYSVIPDFGLDHKAFTFFPNSENLEPFPSTEHRMKVYQQEAIGLGYEAVTDCLNNVKEQASEITHLITVSCTGMYAPGLDIELIQKMGLPTNTERTAINFMGCYAAFNAMKVANNISKVDENAKILIVAVELCSLHFQKSVNEDALISNALFGDGAAAILVGNPDKGQLSFSFEGFYSDLALGGKNEMGWFIKDFGFEMKLTAEVPSIIKSGIKQLTQRLIKKLDFKEITRFAIHPGGRKILEVIEEELNISEEQNIPARETLQRFGNMSSPTVLFTLKNIWNQIDIADNGKYILSFAFGPGLTMESMLLKINRG